MGLGLVALTNAYAYAQPITCTHALTSCVWHMGSDPKVI